MMVTDVGGLMMVTDVGGKIIMLATFSVMLVFLSMY